MILIRNKKQVTLVSAPLSGNLARKNDGGMDGDENSTKI